MIVRLLKEVHGVEANESQIEEALEISGGDLQASLRLLTEGSDELLESLTAQLGAAHPDPIALKRVISSHVDQSGKEAPKRRAAMRDVFSISVQHYRRQMRRQALDENAADSRTLARLDRSVRALREVDRSANQSTLIECFAADIAAAQTGDRGEIG